MFKITTIIWLTPLIIVAPLSLTRVKDVSFILTPAQQIVEGEAALKVGSSGSAPTVVTRTRPIALIVL